MGSKLLIFIVLALLFPISAQAATTIVSPGQSIQSAVDSANSGDTIVVHTGTYPVFTVGKDNLIISGYPGERPVLSGGRGVKLSGSDIILENFEITGVSAPRNAAILSTGNRNIIKNNLVHDNISSGTNGIIVSGSSNRVESNIVYKNNRMGIGIYNGSENIISKNTVYKNTMSAGDSDGIHCIGDVPSQSHDNIISENISYENSDDGIDTWNCAKNQVLNNITYRNGGTGDGHGIKLGYVGGNIVKYNTSYDNYTCGFTSNGGANYYEGNIAYSNDHCGFTDSARHPGNTSSSTFIKNYAYNNPYNFIKGQYTTIFTDNSESPPPTPLSPSPVSSPRNVVGDANGDNKVDGVDYVVWLNNYNKNVTGATSGDFNNSGKVDGVDYVVWMNGYGK